MFKNFILLLTLFIGLTISCNKKTEKKTQINKYDGARIWYEVVEVDSGWGYKIYKEDKVFINQPFVPAVNGKHYFKNKKDATLTAQLVIDKMAKKTGLPSVTLQELDSIGVLDSSMLTTTKEYDYKTNKYQK